MSEAFRGGNSRLLARQFDQLAWPVAVLDQRSQIVFASAALCNHVRVDATRLVGVACQPALPADAAETPGVAQVALLLSPPSEVLHGRAVTRRVPWPPLEPTAEAVQAFLPVIDDDPSTGLILVLFGDPAAMAGRFDLLAGATVPRPPQADELLLRMRTQWQHLDGLAPLLGVSPGITLAMRRAQQALQASANVWIWGPAGCGTGDVARGLFAGRARRLELPLAAVQTQVVDCGLLDVEAFAAALDRFAGRIRPAAPVAAQHLVLEHMEAATQPALAILSGWLDRHGGQISALATCTEPAGHWARKSGLHADVAARLAVYEIELPPLASRREDVPVLFQHALAAAAVRAGRRLQAIAPATLDLLQAFPWPGNWPEVQQAAADTLNNAILTATILPQHLPVAVRTWGGTVGAGRDTTLEPIVLDEVLLQLERILIERAIKISPRNRSRVARLLGISRPRLLRRIEQLGLGATSASAGSAAGQGTSEQAQRDEEE
jgi:hypothetical protein